MSNAGAVAQSFKNLRSRMPLGWKLRYRAARGWMKSWRNVVYDGSRFLDRSSAAKAHPTDEQRAASIVKMYHSIEKGLALPLPRPGFGQSVVRDLCRLVTIDLKAGFAAGHTQHALDAIQHYVTFNQTAGAKYPDECDQVLNLASASGLSHFEPVTKPVTREAIRKATDFDASTFFWSRYSARQFDARPLDVARLTQAIQLAQSSPSVCNRQSARVHVLTDPAIMAKALSFQNGNRGFGDKAGAVLIITSELSHFVDSSERYQPWIDGGMFAMSVVLGLHANRFASCCLNWSVDAPVDSAFHKALGIHPQETVIMLIAVGEWPEEAYVARSPRKPLSDVIQFHP